LFSVSSTAAVFSPVMKEQLLELLPNAFISEAVGSSEGGFNGLRLIEKGSLASGGGLINVNPGPDTVVLDDDNRPVARGQVGRLARGGNVPIGYYKDPVKTAATFVEVDGKRFSIPGDLARLEDDGTITLLGRGSQCINSGGEKIYPEEVEAALKAHPQVYDVLVVGVPDERWGQSVSAVVEPRPGATPTLDDLVEHCRTRIAGYKVPRALHLVDQIPRQPSGKPDYPRAQELAMEVTP
jgi:acyl-CoA synthetase (AMP-forming)/AMP-acid ligase II